MVAHALQAVASQVAMYGASEAPRIPAMLKVTEQPMYRTGAGNSSDTTAPVAAPGCCGRTSPAPLRSSISYDRAHSLGRVTFNPLNRQD